MNQSNEVVLRSAMRLVDHLKNQPESGEFSRKSMSNVSDADLLETAAVSLYELMRRIEERGGRSDGPRA